MEKYYKSLFNNKDIQELLKSLDKIDDIPVIKRNYKFYQHPIKWFKDIKKIKVLQELQNVWWKNNKHLIYKAQEDMCLYGTAIINKKDIK